MTPTQKIKTVVHARHFHVQIVEHTLVLKHCLKACVWITNGSHTNKVTTYLSFLNCSNANEGKIQISVIQKKVSEANSSGSSGFETAVLCIINIPTTITLLSLLDMLNTCFPLAIKSLRRRLVLIVFLFSLAKYLLIFCLPLPFLPSKCGNQILKVCEFEGFMASFHSRMTIFRNVTEESK